MKSLLILLTVAVLFVQCKNSPSDASTSTEQDDIEMDDYEPTVEEMKAEADAQFEEKVKANKANYKLSIEGIGTFENKMMCAESAREDYAYFYCGFIKDIDKERRVIDFTISEFEGKQLESVRCVIVDVDKDNINGIHSIKPREGSTIGGVTSIGVKINGELNLLFCETGTAVISNVKKADLDLVGSSIEMIEYDVVLEGVFDSLRDKDKKYNVKFEGKISNLKM